MKGPPIFFPMKTSFFIVSFLLLGTFGSSRNLLAQSSPSTPASKTSASETAKPQVYASDPAFKRGVELGYDSGIKAGKADKAANHKADPTRHPDYKDAEKKHRSEYGSRASFVRGYQMGFTKGYTFAYTGKKTPLKAPSMGASSSPEPSPSSGSPKNYNPSDDAL